MDTRVIPDTTDESGGYILIVWVFTAEEAFISVEAFFIVRKKRVYRDAWHVWKFMQSIALSPYFDH